MTNLAKAQAYYKAISEKNHEVAIKYLHNEILFKSPLMTFEGKEQMQEAIKNFFNLFNKLTVREFFESKDKVMLAYDLECPSPFHHIPTAVLLTFKDDLISGVELFFDARVFEQKK